LDVLQAVSKVAPLLPSPYWDVQGARQLSQKRNGVSAKFFRNVAFLFSTVKAKCFGKPRFTAHHMGPLSTSLHAFSSPGPSGTLRIRLGHENWADSLACFRRYSRPGRMFKVRGAGRENPRRTLAGTPSVACPSGPPLRAARAAATFPKCCVFIIKY
jgi:hypothetical protein